MMIRVTDPAVIELVLQEVIPGDVYRDREVWADAEHLKYYQEHGKAMWQGEEFREVE